MSKYITVATQYAIYEVPDDAFELLGTGIRDTPPQIVLEILAMGGQVKRVGSVGTLTINLEGSEEFFGDGEDEGDPPEGSGPWITEDDD